MIKANYYENVPELSLSAVILDSAEPINAASVNGTNGVSTSLSSDIALSVEMCQCPPNYAGTSCEVSHHINKFFVKHQQQNIGSDESVNLFIICECFS